MYLFFIVLKAASNTIDRRALIPKLSNRGISTKILEIIQNLYSENSTTVWDGKTLSEWFETNMGVKQGCLLSPLLFSLFVDDITEGLSGRVLFAGHQIKVLMYADDMVLLADSPETLQKMINYTHTYCTNWNLQINLDKSNVMCVKDPRGRLARNERWTLNGIEIEVVKEYKYLETILSSNMSFKKHLQQKLKDAKVALNSTWSSF